MGQRSQIYIRLTDKNGNKDFFANYYQWNYGERMISRARYGIEWIREMMDYLSWERKKISLIFDVNFDMKDVATHHDLVEERKDYRDIWSFKDIVIMGVDNNDGKLLVDVDQAEGTIKYAFLDYVANTDNIMDGESYMKWDNQDDWDIPTRYLNQKAIDICKENIRVISENATLMTRDEAEDFINDDYETILGLNTIEQEGK